MRLARYVAGAVISLVTLAAVACGDDGTDSDRSAQDGSSDFSAVVITNELTTGDNRFAVGVLDGDGPVLGADIALNFLKLTSETEAVARFDADAVYVELERFIINDQTGEKSVTGATGAYTAQVNFDEVGDWGVQITGSTGDGTMIGPLNVGFEVQPPEGVLGVGDAAPKSSQAIAADVADIREIDSASPPDAMHDVTIAVAVSSGQPSVILFGTPAFCETQVCGPMLEGIMVPLLEKYGGEAHFIHVEPYFLETLRNGNGLCAVPAFNLNFARSGIPEGPGPCPSLTEEELAASGESWNLVTEPILFVVGADGVITARFDAIASLDEVERSLVEALP